jgi:hypothetical protein
MSCSHTTGKGLTAVRRSRNGHPEVARTHRGGDKPGKKFPAWNISTECENTSQTAPPRRQLAGEDKVKVMGKTKVKVTDKAIVKVIFPHHTFL